MSMVRLAEAALLERQLSTAGARARKIVAKSALTDHPNTHAVAATYALARTRGQLTRNHVHNRAAPDWFATARPS